MTGKIQNPIAIDFNPQFRRALEIMDKTHRNVFITGRAGTGKSTLLNYFCEHTDKKAVVLAPTGVLFGASVLWLPRPQPWLSRRVLDAFNRRGAFDNLEDSEPALRGILAARFEHVELETVGSVAIFAAANPRTDQTADAVG